jgi:hypothetical protein
MSSPPRTETNSQLMLEVLRKCLPVRKRRELLTALAGCWRDATRDDWTLVAAELPRSEEFSCLLSGPQGLVEYRELLVPRNRVARNPAEVSSARGVPRSGGRMVRPRSFHARHVIGGVVAGSRPFPDDADDLAVLSAALLTQLREIETALPNGIGMDWFNRRKLESLIEFAAGAGHEINNPVAAISGRVQLLLRQESDPERARQLAAIGSNALRISHMIGDTMQFAEPPPMHRERCELGESIKTVLDKLQQRFIEQNVEIKLTRPRELFVDADRNQLETVIAERSPSSSGIRCRGLPRCGRGDRATAFCSASFGPTTSHVRNQIELRLADLRVDFGAVRSVGHAEAGGAELPFTCRARSRVFVAERQHADLLRSQPERERAGEVLDQHADETLHRAERRAVDHHRAVRALSPDVLQLEPFRQVVVELHGAQLPLPAEAVADHEVRLRSVERGFAFGTRRNAVPIRSSTLAQRDSAFPVLGAADVLVAADRGATAARGSRRGRRWQHELVSSSVARNSSSTCSGVQNRWASSWVSPRTRSMPFSSPDCSCR